MHANSPGTVLDLEYFFELCPDFLCVTGFDGYFKKVNLAIIKVLGYTHDEFFTSPILTLLHRDDKESTSLKLKSVIDGATLLNFENRFITKNGSVIWVSWTAVPIKRDRLIFFIGKNITYKKQVEEYDRVSAILGMITEDYKRRFKKNQKHIPASVKSASSNQSKKRISLEPTQSDQHWLNNVETIVRKSIGNLDLNLNLISYELAISERQLYRRVNQMLGITPNTLVRIIRLQIAWEAIASGKYRTISEIANIAGYHSRAHFSKIFKEIYGVEVIELL